MAYFGLSNQTYGLYVWIIETLIVLTLTLAVIEARRLRIEHHRAMVITCYSVQWLMVLSWMGRNFLHNFNRFNTDWDERWTLLLHVIIGSLVLLLATGWIVTMYVDPDIHVAKLKRGKPLMRTVYTLWVINYLIGSFNYFNRWYWKIPIY